jgi:hypothetical protein
VKSRAMTCILAEQSEQSGVSAKLCSVKRTTSLARAGMRRCGAESLSQRLLAFSRQQPLDPRPLDFGHVIPGMSDLLRRTLGEQVTVETRGGRLTFGAS